jgi:hypothetical protein
MLNWISLPIDIERLTTMLGLLWGGTSSAAALLSSRGILLCWLGFPKVPFPASQFDLAIAAESSVSPLSSSSSSLKSSTLQMVPKCVPAGLCDREFGAPSTSLLLAPLLAPKLALQLELSIVEFEAMGVG